MDTRALSAALQTTLDIEEMLSLFWREAEAHIALDGMRYRNDTHGLQCQHGQLGRHRAGFPLTLHEEALGEVSLSRHHPVTEKDRAVIAQLLDTLLYPLRNALRYYIALSTAYRDPLTGLDNRAALEETLVRESEMAQRHNLALTLLIVDLDHFKRINDNHGHAAGDCVLRSAGREMRAALRASDRLFRYGGEEFVLLLPATDLQGGRIVGERIRRSLERQRCEYEGKALGITASVGAAQLGPGDGGDALFERADRALYRAKAEGRNRVCCYPG